MIKHVKWMMNDPMILATFFSTLFFCIAHPQIHLYLMKGITSNFMAIQGIVFASGTLICNSCFHKWGDRLFKLFPYMCITETVVYSTVVPLIACGVIDQKIYFIIDMIMFATITRNMMCSSNRLRRMIYQNEEREKFDNSCPMASAAACILGGLIAMIPMPLWIAWIGVAFGTSIDNVFYAYVYYRVTRKK